MARLFHASNLTRARKPQSHWVATRLHDHQAQWLSQNTKNINKQMDWADTQSNFRQQLQQRCGPINQLANHLHGPAAKFWFLLEYIGLGVLWHLFTWPVARWWHQLKVPPPSSGFALIAVKLIIVVVPSKRIIGGLVFKRELSSLILSIPNYLTKTFVHTNNDNAFVIRPN